MLERTRQLWEKQDQLVGDRHGLFAAIAPAVDAETVLYPGSYVDIAPSFIWPSVTYVDLDRRAKQFFTDDDGVKALLAERTADCDLHSVQFIHTDYTSDLDLPDEARRLILHDNAAALFPDR